MSTVFKWVHKAFDRREFLKLAGGAALAGVAMSVAHARPEPAAIQPKVKTYGCSFDSKKAQYGRERNRYPVAKQ